MSRSSAVSLAWRLSVALMIGSALGLILRGVLG